MKKKFYKHPFTNREYLVCATICTTQQGNICHLLEFYPASGGNCVRFIRYSRGEYRKIINGQFVPVALSSYFPHLTARGLL